LPFQIQRLAKVAVPPKVTVTSAVSCFC
jgi:hypothetical protein